MTNRIGRSIFAVLLALAIATLPASLGFAVGAPAATAAPVAQAVPDCDHHHNLPSDTTQKSADGCDSMAGCALKCFTVTTVSFSSITSITSVGIPLEQIRASDNISSRMGSPPFRPPRS